VISHHPDLGDLGHLLEDRDDVRHQRPPRDVEEDLALAVDR
jgi:hypothetical protein